MKCLLSTLLLTALSLISAAQSVRISRPNYSGGDTIALFTLNGLEANKYLAIYNATGVGSNFLPTILGSSNTNNSGLLHVAQVSNDTTTIAAMAFDSRESSGPIATGPIFQWRNYGSAKMTMLADGTLGLGTASPDVDAILDLQSTTKGLLIPRMSSTQRNAISGPATGLMVYDLTKQNYWYFNGGQWKVIGGDVQTKISDADGDTRIETEYAPDEDILRCFAGGDPLMYLSSDGGALVGGFNNYEPAARSFVAGGLGNKITQQYGSIAGGQFGRLGGFGGFIGGGYQDSISATGTYSFIGAGYQNVISNEQAFIGAGAYCMAKAKGSLIGGGSNDTTFLGASYSFIAGGLSNATRALYAFVGGGSHNSANAAQSSVAGGDSNTASATNASVTGGASNTASGTNASVTGGFSNTASGQKATVAGGDSNIASGTNASATGGLSNTASGINASVTGGHTNLVSGENSAILNGLGNSVTGNYASVISGRYSSAAGNFSTAFGGEGLKANSMSQSVVGRYNLNTSGNASTWLGSEELFVVGNGTSDMARSNALTILKNGNVGIGTAIPSSTLEVAGNTKVDGSTFNVDATNNRVGIGTASPAYPLHVVGNAQFNSTLEVTGNTKVDGSTFNVDATNNRVGIGTASPAYPLQVVGNAQFNNTIIASGGISVYDPFRIYHTTQNVYWQLYTFSDGHLYFNKNGQPLAYVQSINGAWMTLSDARLKKNVQPLSNIIEDVVRLRPATYHFNTQSDTDELNYGFIAQEVHEIFPEAVDYNANEDLYTINYAVFGVLAIEAIKEQQAQIDDLQRQLENINKHLGLTAEQ